MQYVVQTRSNIGHDLLRGLQTAGWENVCHARHRTACILCNLVGARRENPQHQDEEHLSQGIASWPLSLFLTLAVFAPMLGKYSLLATGCTAFLIAYQLTMKSRWFMYLLVMECRSGVENALSETMDGFRGSIITPSQDAQNGFRGPGFRRR